MFFYWFGVVTFSILALVILLALFMNGKDIFFNIIRFVIKKKFQLKNKPKYKLGDIVDWEVELDIIVEYKIVEVWCGDMNSDTNFRWKYRLELIDDAIDEHQYIITSEKAIKLSKRVKRNENISKILEET